MFRNKSPEVLVRYQGRWVRGRMIDTVSDIDGLWQGLVRFTPADGQRRCEWHHAADLRPTVR